MFIGHYPNSHSLVALAAWGTALGVGYLVARKAGVRFMGPPPPSVEAVAWSANALWLVVAWGYWIDRHRRMAP